MQDQRDAGGVKRAAGERRPLRGGGGRQRVAPHVRVVDPGLLEQLAAGQDARAPAASAVALPAVLAKARASVRLFERGAQAVLETDQIGVHRREVDGFGHSLGHIVALHSRRARRS